MIWCLEVVSPMLQSSRVYVKISVLDPVGVVNIFIGVRVPSQRRIFIYDG